MTGPSGSARSASRMPRRSAAGAASSTDSRANPAEIDGRAIQRQTLLVEAGDDEEVAHQPLQPSGVALEHPQEAAPLLGIERLALLSLAQRSR